MPSEFRMDETGQFRVARMPLIEDAESYTMSGRNAVQLTQKLAGSRLNFDEIAERLRPHGTVNVNKFMLRADIKDNGEPYELTLFTDGRAIVKGTKEPNTAKSIYAKYVGA